MDVHLQSNEGIVIPKENLSDGELILTNLNIIYTNIKKSAFGKVKSENTHKYSIGNIKVVNNQPQVFMNREGGSPRLQIFFKDGEVIFNFSDSSKRKILKWVDSISKLALGESVSFKQSNYTSAIPGVENVAETFKDTVGIFKNTFGIGSKTKESVIVNNNVTSKCIGCMAPISGTKGSTVRCKYCDTDQTL